MEAGEALEMAKFLLVGVNVLLFAMAVTLFASAPSSRRSPASLSRSGGSSGGGLKRALLVTAHPDDESMFFLPLLRSLREQRDPTEDEWQVHLLVLSRGNFDGLGDERDVEMRNCAAFLGIEADNVRVLEDPKLQDGMQNRWSVDYIAALVLEYIESKRIDAVFTFDDYGVSGHPNHVSVYRGVRSALRLVKEKCDAASTDEDSKDKPARRVRGWALESTNILRKYIGVLDAPLSFWLAGRNGAAPDDSAFVFSFRPAWNYRAMKLHHSQFVWYRRLFVVFSRYTFVNTFQPIVPSGVASDGATLATQKKSR